MGRSWARPFLEQLDLIAIVVSTANHQSDCSALSNYTCPHQFLTQLRVPISETDQTSSQNSSSNQCADGHKGVLDGLLPLQLEVLHVERWRRRIAASTALLHSRRRGGGETRRKKEATSATAAVRHFGFTGALLACCRRSSASEGGRVCAPLD